MIAPLAAIGAGLDKVGRLAPGSGFVDLRGVITPEAMGARLVAAWRPKTWLEAYGEASVERTRLGPFRASVGAGLRVSW